MTGIHPRGPHHMPVRRPRPAARAITAIAFVLMLAGCGGSASGDGSAAGRASATPDGTSSTSGQQGSIVFRRWTDSAQTHGVIFTIAPDGTGERQLVRPTASSSDDFPDFAADGSRIAFQRCDASRPVCRILTVRPDGTELRPVGGCQRGGSGSRCSSMSYPAIAANGRIAFVRAVGGFSEDGYQRQGISTMRADGSGLRRVTLQRAGAARDDEPQWSPDGRWIVFVRDNFAAEPTLGKAIFIVHSDGSGLRRLTPWELRAGDGPNWSPDGKRILFRSNESEDFTNSNLFTVGIDGTGLEQVTHVEPTTRLYSSGYSPDGTSITFGMQGTDGAADVFTMRLDGTGLRPVTRTPLGDSAPDWGGAPG